MWHSDRNRAFGPNRASNYRRDVIPRNPVRLVARMHRTILPLAQTELDHWRRCAARIPDRALRDQALHSIATKAIHCLGGSVYATQHPARARTLVTFIVAFETILDYLDGVLDERPGAGSTYDEAMQLHLAVLDALSPDTPRADYYEHSVCKDDGGYLEALVETCRAQLRAVPAYGRIARVLLSLGQQYSEVQANKNLAQPLRRPSLERWADAWGAQNRDCHWNELAAAAGSPLGIFALVAAASFDDIPQSELDQLATAYVPCLAALPNLLDHIVDLEDDSVSGELNYAAVYPSRTVLLERMQWLIIEARARCEGLLSAPFHKMLIEGLIALYMTDAKVIRSKATKNVAVQLMRRSPLARIFFWLNSQYIRARTMTRSRMA